MKVESVGHERFEFVKQSFEKYKIQRDQLFNEFHELLPYWGQLKNFGDIRDLKILTKTMIVTAIKQNSEIIQVKFKPCFITDFASVPRFLRGIIANGDPVMIPAVLLHDYGFSTHYDSFKNVNLLFKKMLLDAGYSKILTQIAFMSVNSIFARRKWNKAKKRKYWTLETTERFEHN